MERRSKSHPEMSRNNKNYESGEYRRCHADETNRNQEQQGPVISEERLKEAEKYIEEEEGVTRRLSGSLDIFITVIAVSHVLVSPLRRRGHRNHPDSTGCSCGFCPFLGLPGFPPCKKVKHRIAWYDIGLALLGVSTIVYMLFDFEEFIYRAVTPTFWDIAFGSHLYPAGSGGRSPGNGLDHAFDQPPFFDLCLFRSLPALSLDASRLRCGTDRRPYVHDPGRDLSGYRSMSPPPLLSCLPFMGRFSNIPGPENFLSTFPLPPWAASPPEPAGP